MFPVREGSKLNPLRKPARYHFFHNAEQSSLVSENIPIKYSEKPRKFPLVSCFILLGKMLNVELFGDPCRTLSVWGIILCLESFHSETLTGTILEANYG